MMTLLRVVSFMTMWFKSAWTKLTVDHGETGMVGHQINHLKVWYCGGHSCGIIGGMIVYCMVAGDWYMLYNTVGMVTYDMVWYGMVPVTSTIPYHIVSHINTKKPTMPCSPFIQNRENECTF